MRQTLSYELGSAPLATKVWMGFGYLNFNWRKLKSERTDLDGIRKLHNRFIHKIKSVQYFQTSWPLDYVYLSLAFFLRNFRKMLKLGKNAPISGVWVKPNCVASCSDSAFWQKRGVVWSNFSPNHECGTPYYYWYPKHLGALDDITTNNCNSY